MDDGGGARLPARFAVACAIALALVPLASAMATGRGPGELDRRLVDAVLLDARDVGPGSIGDIARDLTALGSATVLLFAALAGVAGLAAARRGRDAARLAAAGAGGWVLGEAIKALVDRPRPAPAVVLDAVDGASFPSGHALSSATVLLSLALLLAPRRGAARATVQGAAVLAVLAVGITRVVLGVHHPTDVLAGWALGGGWAWICLGTGRRRPPA